MGAEAVGSSVAVAATGVGHGRIHIVKVRLPPKRVERVVIDRKNRRIAIKASAENEDGEVFGTGWFGMAVRSFPDDLIPALRDAFGAKVEEGPLKTDQTRALVLLAVLLLIAVVGLVAFRPF